MASKYLIQVVEKDTGQTVSWAPGLEVEKQFEDDLCNRIAAKGVGVFRATNHVVKDVRAAIHELLFDLKSQV